jgi:hypothetical protein
MRAGGDTVEEPVEVAPPVVVEEPVVEEEAPEPVVEEEAPVVEEEAPEPVVEEEAPEPVIKKRVKPAAEAPEVEEPAEEPAPIEVFEEKEADDAARPVREQRAEKQAGPCDMDSYEPADVDDLEDDGEIARGEKVDRNDNGSVCRKEIPGQGRGNTGNGTNIKDDKVK